MKQITNIKDFKKKIDEILSSTLSVEQIRKGVHFYEQCGTNWRINPWYWPTEDNEKSEITKDDQILLLSKAIKAAVVLISITGGRSDEYVFRIRINDNEFWERDFSCSKEKPFVLKNNSSIFTMVKEVIEKLIQHAVPILEYAN